MRTRSPASFGANFAPEVQGKYLAVPDRRERDHGHVHRGPPPGALDDDVAHRADRPEGEQEGKTEQDALIAYLQGMGTALKGVK